MKNASKQLTFVVPDLIQKGAILSTVYLINHLCARGWDATMAVVTSNKPTSVKDSATYKMLFNPINFNGMMDFARHFPEAGRDGLMVNISWTQCHFVGELQRIFPDRYKSLAWIRADELALVKELYPDDRYTDVVEKYWTWDNMLGNSEFTKNKINSYRKEKEIAENCSSLPVGFNDDLFNTKKRKKVDKQSIKKICCLFNNDLPWRRPENGATIVETIYDIYGPNSVEIHAVGPAVTRCNVPHINHGKLIPEEMASLLKTMDVFIDPTENHAWGIPKMEAAACGCFSVFPDDGANMEPVEKIGDSWCFPYKVNDMKSAVASVQSALASLPAVPPQALYDLYSWSALVDPYESYLSTFFDEG